MIRIENPNDGEGFWNSSQFREKFSNYELYENFLNKHETFPNPLDENLNLIPKAYCAFTSVDVMKDLIDFDDCLGFILSFI